MVRWIATLVVAVNSNRRAGEVAAGIASAMLLALIPGGNLLWRVLFLLTFLLKINLAAELLFLALFRLLGPLGDGLLDPLGYFLLTLPALQGPFTALYNLPLMPLTRFNDTLVLGGLAAGLALWLPAFLGARALVSVYRRRWRDRLAGGRIVQIFRRIPLVSSIAAAAAKMGGGVVG